MATAADLRRMHPRRVREYRGGPEEPPAALETTHTREGAPLIRRLRAGSTHFAHYAFRTTFVSKCLDSGMLQAALGRRFMSKAGEMVLLGEGIAAINARRVARSSGAACAGGSKHGVVVFTERSALDSAAEMASVHGCHAFSLVFAAHSLEEKHCDRLSAEEAELLARTSYGLAYITQADRCDLARGYGSEWPDDAGVGAGALVGAAAYPRPGAEEGVAIENIWVLRERAGADYGEECGEFLPAEGAWPVAFAYGVVREPVAEDASAEVDSTETLAARLRYKRQVAHAIQACAVTGCDGLLIGCAEGVLRGEMAPRISDTVAAEVWAEVLLGEGGRPGLASHFRAIAFCLGAGRTPGTSPRRERLLSLLLDVEIASVLCVRTCLRASGRGEHRLSAVQLDLSVSSLRALGVATGPPSRGRA
eukprot:CAMPEP_0170246998 /NCGR_PEP_ID=MMETSP0116_2-20130129/23286_1 /TAXON_ID=400756 /ORGANISM="Durinskia baltica, Strain CSIRO CS-38" /LENGTH=420 /DNA_ID=CAMNT_0010497875 /DNA_START=60 /DNA_END=1320 /DNA_ORIENTATION=+